MFWWETLSLLILYCVHQTCCTTKMKLHSVKLMNYTRIFLSLCWRVLNHLTCLNWKIFVTFKSCLRDNIKLTMKIKMNWSFHIYTSSCRMHMAESKHDLWLPYFIQSKSALRFNKNIESICSCFTLLSLISTLSVNVEFTQQNRQNSIHQKMQVTSLNC